MLHTRQRYLVERTSYGWDFFISLPSNGYPPRWFRQGVRAGALRTRFPYYSDRGKVLVIVCINHRTSLPARVAVILPDPWTFFTKSHILSVSIIIGLVIFPGVPHPAHQIISWRTPNAAAMIGLYFSGIFDPLSQWWTFWRLTPHRLASQAPLRSWTSKSFSMFLISLLFICLLYMVMVQWFRHSCEFHFFLYRCCSSTPFVYV